MTTNDKDLSYWIGQVDARLKEIEEKLTNSIELENARWNELAEWKHSVNERLAYGSAKFTAIRSALDADEEILHGMDTILRNGKSGKSRGLIGRVLALEEWKSNIKTVLIALTIAIVTDIAIRIIGAIMK